MENEKGCPLRDYCKVYSSEYSRSPIIKENFIGYCNKTPTKEFTEGNCPLYDNYIAILEFISETFDHVNEGLEKLIKSLKNK